MSAVPASALRARAVAGPSMPGIITSSRMASGRSAAAIRSPSAPDEAVTTSHPAVISSDICATSRMSSSSSTSRILRLIVRSSYAAWVRCG